jgi:hypothetical protein
MSDNPKYSEKEKFVELNLLYDIDMEINNNTAIGYPQIADADDKNYLYIPDSRYSQIFVFDDKGKFVRTMGQKGEGPRDLLNPLSISIYRDTMYIYESGKGIKVWDLTGKYITYILPKRSENCAVFKRIDNYIFSSGGTIDLKEGTSTCILFRYDSKLKEKIEIASFIIGMRKNIDFVSPNLIVPIDSKGNSYYLEDLDKYQINKYDINGKKIISFGRKYKPEKLSEEMLEYRKEIFKKEGIETYYSEVLKREYPTIISNIFVDSKDYVWVATGYINGITFLKKDYMEIIDIFDQDGTYLYTFKTTALRVLSFIKNNRLFSSFTESYDTKAYMYDIKYNK